MTDSELKKLKDDLWHSEEAYYDFINSAPDDAHKATLVKNAMEAIERENPKMAGVLPKAVYGQLVPEEEPELLSKIVRVFKDIPETISIDLCGEIDEYFLGNFALVEGQDGGMTEAEFAAEMAKMNEELRALGEEARRLEGEILGDGGRISG